MTISNPGWFVDNHKENPGRARNDGFDAIAALVYKFIELTK